MSAVVGGAILGGATLIGGIGGALISSGATKDAANTQAQATQYAANLQNDQFNKMQANESPFVDVGKGALGQLSSMAANPVSFSAEDFKNNMDPAYQFNLEQGQQALERSAAARGTLMSGGTLKDLTNYSQGAASNEYSNAYNRFMNNQNTQFNRLSSLSSLGQNAAANVGNNGAAAAASIGNTVTSGANAQAAAQIAGGNIWGGTLSGLGSSLGKTYMQGSMLNNMYPSAPSAPMGAMGYSTNQLNPGNQQALANLLAN